MFRNRHVDSEKGEVRQRDAAEGRFEFVSILDVLQEVREEVPAPLLRPGGVHGIDDGPNRIGAGMD